MLASTGPCVFCSKTPPSLTFPYVRFVTPVPGLVTLRAFRVEQQMRSQFLAFLHDNVRADMSFTTMSRWMGKKQHI